MFLETSLLWLVLHDMLTDGASWDLHEIVPVICWLCGSTARPVLLNVVENWLAWVVIACLWTILLGYEIFLRAAFVSTVVPFAIFRHYGFLF